MPPTSLALEDARQDECACPSTRALPGAHLIGIVGSDGAVQPILPSLRIDQDFIAAATPHGPLEQRFRFAGRCIEGACRQWTGSGCGVVERVLGALAAEPEVMARPLPRCAIRATCRWYHQRGAAACRPCSFVVTDATGDGPPA